MYSRHAARHLPPVRLSAVTRHGGFTETNNKHYAFIIHIPWSLASVRSRMFCIDSALCSRVCSEGKNSRTRGSAFSATNGSRSSPRHILSPRRSVASTLESYIGVWRADSKATVARTLGNFLEESWRVGNHCGVCRYRPISRTSRFARRQLITVTTATPITPRALRI